MGYVYEMIKKQHPDAKATYIYDFFNFEVGDYAGEFENHPSRYKAELEARAAQGDKYAEALLKGDYLGEP